MAGLPADFDLVPFWGHSGGVSAVAVTPDGRSIVSGGRDDYTVRVWDRESGRERACFAGHDGPVVALAVTPDGRLVISGGDGTVRVWDLDTGAQQAVFTHWLEEPTAGSSGISDEVTAVALTSDGRRVVSAGWYGPIRVWDRDSGRQLATVDVTGVTELVVTPDGRQVVTSHLDDEASVRVHDLAAGREVSRFTTGVDFSAAISALALAPDGRRIVGGSPDGMLRVWDLAVGREQACLTGHDGGVRAVAVTPDGQQIVSGGDDGAVRLWDLASGTTQARLVGHTGEVSAVALTPDGQGVVTGGHDGMLRVWDRQTGREQVCLGPAGTRTGLPFRHADPVSAVAVTPDGQWIVSGDLGGAVRVWDLPGGREQACLTGHAGPVWAVAVTPDGRRIISGGDGDGTIRVWDRKSGRELARYAPGRSVRRFPGRVKGVAAVAVTPDGRRIVIGDLDGTVWAMDTDAHRRRCLGRHKDWASTVAITPDGRQAVSSGGDGTLRLWETWPGTGNMPASPAITATCERSR